MKGVYRIGVSGITNDDEGIFFIAGVKYRLPSCIVDYFGVKTGDELDVRVGVTGEIVPIFMSAVEYYPHPRKPISRRRSRGRKHPSIAAE